MYRFVVSTVGTSLLSNQIRPKDPKSWKGLLNKTANWTEERIKRHEPEVINILLDLKNRAEEKLNSGNILEIKEASAELNGIYSLYKDNVENGKLDTHWLITTETYQGQSTAKIIKDFLHKKVNFIEIYTPDQLSTEDTANFKQGIDDLINWLSKRHEESQKDGYSIYFNLVGGFKAIQGCMNTIGMFYADKIIYVFEGESSKLITIPRLPITVDSERVKKHKVTLALLNAGASFSPKQIEDEKIEESLFTEIDGKVTISNWGLLIWNECKINLLSEDLLIFPKLHYEDNFRGDYNRIRDKKEKLQLQEDLAKVSNLLNQSNGNTSVLKEHTGFRYDKYTNRNDDVAHFRVTQGLRISCISISGILRLRRYGKEPEVNKNP
ncbi:putative CRISPR-associated protein [Anabaena sp. CCY 9402-a]|uniref:putative CRISPR-associated protein n=1 Tax=Anabaena sp. CCY 9402-a TaxID=3103867 RepID=UPI0039C64E85